MRRPDTVLFFIIIPSGMHHNRSNNPDEVKKKYRRIGPLGDIPITGKHYCGNIEEQERHHHKGELSQHKGSNSFHRRSAITRLPEMLMILSAGI